jgi:predicted transcriptional regulator
VTSLNQMVAAIDARIAALETEADKLRTAKAALVEAFGGAAAAPAAARETPAPRAVRQARPTEARARILDVLRKNREPMGPRAVAKAVGTNAAAVAYHLKNLVRSGEAMKSGNASATKYSAA